MRLPVPPLLLITDRGQARAPLAGIVAAAFEGGCRWVSLREKDLPAAGQIALARDLLAIARAHGATVTLHGTAELARAAGVDGVHLPGGADVVAARDLLGADALIGVSVHAPAEAGRISAGAADYVVAGPAFETASKPGYGPALGLAGITAMAQATDLPVIAVGGITSSNAADVLGAGAAGLAVMGGVMRAADPASEIAALMRTMTLKPRR